MCDVLTFYTFTTAETYFCVPREGIGKSGITLVWERCGCCLHFCSGCINM